MFALSRLRGTKGVRVVPGFIRPSSPWHEKVKLEIEREAENVRADPGAFIGNPMATEDINNLKAAAKKDARRNGQHPATSRNASPDTLHKLYTALLVNEVGGSAPVTAPLRVATDAVLSDGDANCPPPPENDGPLASILKTNSVAYVFFAFLFVTLARPVTMINMRFMDIVPPDLLDAENLDFPNRQEHPRFLDLTPRISKNGTKATDLLVVRVHSYYAYISPDEEVGFGLLCSVQCSHPHLNFPQLFMVLLNLAANAPTIDNHGGLLADLLLFPGMWTGSKGSRVIFMRPRSEAEINSCLTQDLRITLRSTLHSYTQDDVTHVVAQVYCTYNTWAVGVLNSQRARMTGPWLASPLNAAGVASFDDEAVGKLGEMFLECVMQLRHGRGRAVVDSEKADS
ncbi:hypothetical protein BU14_0785s0001 [Porphyra umbilicalis]|uniref:Uncharacterized protein n=1 Tax=Porphyra umbilicalis TaxID=2786 RepID=A0A1X6NNZ2_PORUM|nr:hypothetical protein BU14_0785s0001 [Porphyra umbilicalis]|eukprot:OSX70324.1 hypothetical protein BU14_0785s0001 [Porphyra umbilicalis]